MNFKKLIIPSAVVLALVALTVWKLASNKETMEKQAALANEKRVIFPVTIVKPTRQMISQNFEQTGIFNPVHNLMLQSEVAGRITSLKIKEGDYVTQGQVLVQLDNEQTIIDLQLAQSALEKSKSDLAKLEAMLQGDAASKQQVEDAKLGVKDGEAKVASLKRLLRLLSITAPISGYINNFSLEVGSFLSPGAVVAEIVDISRIKMVVKLLDYQVLEVKNGQTVTITPDLYQGVRIEGKIVSIAAKADGSRRFEAEIEFPNNKENPIKAGMTGKALFSFGSTKETTTIPVKCLVDGVQDPKVYLVKDSLAYLRKIVAGGISNDLVEVISGLDQSDMVVETGQLNLSNEAQVQIIK